MEGKDFESEVWIGRELGKYRIEKLLGFGGMGAVYLAFHTLLDKNVALKMLFPSLVHPGKNSLARFLREAKAAAKLDHPNIVQVYDIDMAENVYFIVMQYIEGKTVWQIIEERERFSISETVRVGIEVAKALEFAHKNGVIHRDIKPANIMVTMDGGVKLADFGTARWINAKTTLTGSSDILGTPVYNSPEAIFGEKVDQRTDLYSLGITMFHMLAGVPPYTGRNPITISMQHLEAPIPSITAHRSETPAELDEVLKKLMAKKPEGRFTLAKELIRALEYCAGKIVEMPEKQESKEQEDAFAPKVEVASGKKTRVLVIDDSPVMCKAISRVLAKDPALDVVGISHNGKEALEAIPKLNPDVITMDVNMPVMDGVATLKRVMVQWPMPVIMLSAFTYDGALTTFHCLSYGAVGFIWKSSHANKEEFNKELLEKVQNAARLELIPSRKPRIVKTRDIPYGKAAPATWAVVMGAGESGYHSYLKIIPHIPKNIPCAILVVQEMPDEMVEVFANYLNRYSRITVRTIQDYTPLARGICYVTNHLSQVRLREKSGRGICIMEEENPRSVFWRLLSDSVDIFGHRTIGVVLSGKNTDAIKGLKQVKEAGGIVLAQKPTTCLNPETAKLAIEEQATSKTVLEVDIPSILWHILKKKRA